MGNIGLELHQNLSYVKATAVFLKCDTLWSKRYQEINTIYNILMKQIYLIRDQNTLEKEFTEKEDEEVQDEY